MKIVHLASGDLWGGAEAQLYALAAAQARRERTIVSVVLLTKGSQLAEKLRAARVRVVELDESTASIFTLSLGLFRHLRAERPDVLHTHRFKENILGALIALMLRIPNLRTVHGAPEPELGVPTLRRRILEATDQWVARRLQYCAVAVSTELSQKLPALLPGARIELVLNGLSVPETVELARQPVPAIPKNSATAIRIGYFGRIVPIKRLDLFLRTAHELSMTVDQEFEFYIVGDGPERAQMEALASRLGLDAVVHFLGFQKHAMPLLGQMDIVAMTSDHEGLPMIVLEALALGVPVVARAVGGIPEVLQGATGCALVDSDSPVDLAKAIRSSRRQRQASAKGVSLLPEMYSIDATSTQYLALYRRAVDAR